MLQDHVLSRIFKRCLLLKVSSRGLDSGNVHWFIALSPVVNELCASEYVCGYGTLLNKVHKKTT